MTTAARADSMGVEDVIRLAREGRLRMPSFQRPIRWEPSDRRDLLDSIYRGYPVGTLLLWKNPPSNLQVGRSLEGVSPGVPGGEQFLVVDGQQRLTTLWDALGRRPQRGERALVFDMERDEVVSRALTPDELEGRAPTQGGLPQVPLYLVLDAASLSEWVPASLSTDDRRRYFELGKRLREYKVGLYIVEGADVEALRHVFDRINTTGKPMSRDDVFEALVGSRVGTDGSTGLALVNARLNDLGFGSPETSTTLKAFEAIRGAKVGRLDPRTLDIADAEAGLNQTALALRAAVGFLLNEAHVPHVKVCPYELPIVVLARFFALHPEVSERNRILLRRWFWRGALGERLGGASGSMQQHVDDVTEREDEAVQSLLRRTGSPEGIQLDDWDRTKSTSVASARGKALLCALLSMQPRDLRSGDRLDAHQLFGDRATEPLRPIVRSSELSSAGVVNKLLHPSAGAAPRQLILECTDEAALVSHGIDEGARDALRMGDVDGFLRRRDAALDRATRAFFERQVELARDDAPPLSAIARRSA